MTEPIAVDVALKSVPVPKPVTVSPPAVPKPPVPTAGVTPPAPPPAAKPPEPAPPLPPSSPSLISRITGKFTKKNAAIGASALFSLAAGIAGVRLMLPSDDSDPKQTAKATQPLPESKSTAPAKPSVSVEPAKPFETIPAPAMALPVAPSATPPAPPARPTVYTDPVIPITGTAPSAGPAASALPPLPAVPSLPALPPLPGSTPTGDGFAAAKPLPKDGVPSVAPDLDLGTPIAPSRPMMPPIVTIGGAEPPTLPALPPLPGTTPGGIAKPDPKLPDPKLPDPKLPDPKLPDPKLPDVKLPDPKLPDPKGPVQGSPVGGGSDTPKLPALPMTGGTGTLPIIPVGPPTGTVPTMPPDLGPLPPAKTPADLNPGGGMKIEFTKPATTPAVTPTGGTDRTPTTSYDVDIYDPKTGDNWETISREFYNDPRYASGLRAYNRNKPLNAGSVDVPPIHIVKKYMPGAGPAGGGGLPATGSGVGALPDWGAATPPVRTSEKSFRVPTGGMSMRAVARITLGNEQRWDDISRLNPHLKADEILPAGTDLKLPADARNPG